MILVPDSTANSNKIAKENLRLTSEPLDVRHIACPPALWILIPVMKSALNGEVIQILTTDPHDKDDIRRWLKKIGGGNRQCDTRTGIRENFGSQIQSGVIRKFRHAKQFPIFPRT